MLKKIKTAHIATYDEYRFKNAFKHMKTQICYNFSNCMPDSNQIHLATLWFLSARAMAIAGEDMHTVQEAATGLYAQAILGFTEEICRESKDAGHINNKTLIDCLSGVRQLPKDMAEKILTGVMMISYAERKMKPLEVRWASMLASAIEATPDEFQRCCVNARVIASMLRPHGAAT